MSEPFVGEIRIFAMGFAPKGWAQCNGQLLPIQGNQALFTILGNSFGGDGTTNFALPNLQGRVPLQMTNLTAVGQNGGEEAHVLTVNEMPGHTHTATAGADSTSFTPVGTVWGGAALNNYAPQAGGQMSQAALATSGNSQAHPNMQPYLAFNFCIATVGYYPSKN